MKKTKLVVVLLLTVACLLMISPSDVKAEVVVYDADDQFLGILLNGKTSDANIYISSLGKYIYISYSDGTATGIRSVLFFESNDCTGPAFIGARSIYFISLNGDNLYTGDSTSPVVINYNSKLNTDGTTCKQNSGSMDSIPALKVSTPFTMPVALPLRFQHEPAHPGKWKK